VRQFFVSLAIVLNAFAAFAQTPLAPLFESTFESNYRAGECGTNIMNLVKLANQSGLDTSAMNIIQITNKGLFNFGMVGGYEARAYRFPPPTREKIAYTDLRSWFHHVVLEHEGYIYDYDFGIEPRITPVAEYVERMFLPDRKWSMGAKITPREERLQNYQVELHSASDYLSQKRGEGVVMSLGQLLEQF
jgi:hypothetical protein